MPIRVLLDTNVYTRREDSSKSVPSNVSDLFRVLHSLGVLIGKHINIYNDLRNYQDNVFVSKLSCYPSFEPTPGMSGDSIFLQEVGSSTEIDNQLLYEAYTGSVDYLITDDCSKSTSLCAKAEKLEVREKVLTVNEALAEFGRLLEQKSTASDFFVSWQQAWAKLIERQPLSAVVELVGRATELTELRAAVGNPDIRTIVVSGINSVGKTRLVLEATKHRQNETYLVDFEALYSFSSKDLSLSLTSFDAETVIIDNLDPQLIETVTTELAAGLPEHAKLIITTTESFFLPSLDCKIGTASQKVVPLSQEDAFSLLHAAPTRLDVNTQSWLVEDAKGIPGHLLEGAVLLERRRKGASSHASLAAALGKSAEEDIRMVLKNDDLARLQLVSVLTRVRVSKSDSHELQAICKTYGDESFGTHIDTICN